MKIRNIVMLLLVACALASSLSGATLAEWPSGFVAEKQGANGWWYLFSKDGRYNPSEQDWAMTTLAGNCYREADAGCGMWYIGTAVTGRGGDPVLRWVSTVSGAVKISGNVKNNRISTSPDADGFTFRVMVNGREEWSKTVAKDDASAFNFNISANVSKGDDIDFAVSRNSTHWFDEAKFQVKIEGTPASAWVRVRLASAEPSGVPVQVACSVFGAIHETLGKFGMGKSGSRMDFSTGWRNNMDWRRIPESEQIRAGESTGWVDISEALAKDPAMKTLAFTFNSPAAPAFAFADLNYMPDMGNLGAVSATIDFADGPDEKLIRESVTASADESSVLAVVIPDSKDPARHFSGIRTVYDITLARLGALDKLGIADAPLPKQFLVCGTIYPAYHFPFYDKKTSVLEASIMRRMGVEYVQAFPSINGLWRYSSAVREKGVSPDFIMIDGPVGMHQNIWDPELFNIAVKKLQSTYSTYTKYARPLPGDKIIVKVWDEPRIVTTDILKKHPDGLAAFRTWLKERGIAPSSVGHPDYASVMPAENEKAADREGAYLYYLTTRFRQETDARAWATLRRAIHQVFGERAVVVTCMVNGSFSVHPDYFIAAKEGSLDQMVNHYGWGAGLPLMPGAQNFLVSNAIRSASKFGKSAPGVLLRVFRTETGNGTRLSGESALINGMRAFWLYAIAPRYGHWGWFNDDVLNMENSVAVARTMQTAAKAEKWLLSGKTPHAETAVLFDHSNDCWSGGTEVSPGKGQLTERRMLQLFLATNQVPSDILTEDDLESHLKDYKVLYITDINISREAAKTVAGWVKNGGILFTTAGAATRDEANQPQNLLLSLAGKGAEIREAAGYDLPKYTEYNGIYKLPVLDGVAWGDAGGLEFAAVARREEISVPGASTLARYRKSGSPAAVVFNCGAGKVVRVGTSPGTSWARTADPAFAPSDRDKGAFNRTYSPGMEKVYEYPLELAGVRRPLRVSAPWVHAQIFELPESALIVMADYASTGERKVDVEVSTGRRYTACRTLDGLPAGRVTQLSDVRLKICDVPLNLTAELVLSDR